DGSDLVYCDIYYDSIKNRTDIVSAFFDDTFELYTLGSMAPIYRLSAINLKINPDINDTPNIRSVEVIITNVGYSPKTEGVYTFEVDDFPKSLDTNFTTAYTLNTTEKIADTKKHKSITRKYNNSE